MTQPQKDFLQQAHSAALRSGHIFPEMAACEAALESGHRDPVTKVFLYGGSQLAREDNNLFGMKQHRHMIYGTVNLPTREFQNSAWIHITAAFVKYPDWASCFADRMATLQRLASVYPHYKHALDAGSATTYIHEVSQTWSTDPERADKVLAIYDHIAGDWSAVQN